MRISVPKRLDHEFGEVLSFHTDDGTTVCRADGSARSDHPFTQFEVSRTGSIAWLDWIDFDASSLVRRGKREPGMVLVVDSPLSGTSVRVTPEMHILDVAWSHDGAVLWFSTGGVSPRQLYSADPTAERIQCFGAGVDPIPAPDGSTVAFFGLEPPGVYLLNSATGDVQRVADGMPQCWSPDSSKLAFLQVVEDRWQLFCYSTRDGAIRHIAAECEFVYWPSWTPDGESIVFEYSPQGAAGPPSQVALSGMDPGTLRLLSAGPNDERPRHHPVLPLVTYQVRDPGDHDKCDVYVESLVSGSRTCLGPGSEPRWLP